MIKQTAKFKINKSRIRYYFYLGSLLPIFLLFAILFSTYLDGIKKEQVATIEQLSQALLLEKKSFLKTSVEHVITTIEHVKADIERSNPEFTLEQVETATTTKMAAIIHSIRLGSEDRYIWVNKILNYEGGDGYAIRLIHPNKELPEGELLSTNIQDEHGNYPFLGELNGIKNEGEVYWEYYINKMNSTESFRKLSYAKLYEPFNWAIATGIYLDDFEKTIVLESQKLEETYRLQKQFSLIVSVFSLTIVTLMVLFFEKSIRNLLKRYEQQQQGYNKQLRLLSITDQLTGLHNRLHLDNIFMAEIQKAKRYGRPFSIVALDFDYFKRINDEHGHQTGDSVLIELSRLLKQHVREADTLGRWGGEEFLIICPETNLRGAVQLAENLRIAIEKYDFKVIGFSTSSFGVASYRPGDTEELMMERADNALYKAKALGRNQVAAEAS